MRAIGKKEHCPMPPTAQRIFILKFSLLIFCYLKPNISLNSLGMRVSKDLGLRRVCISGVRGKRLGSAMGIYYFIEKALK